jgi:hypothetical protein
MVKVNIKRKNPPFKKIKWRALLVAWRVDPRVGRGGRPRAARDRAAQQHAAQPAPHCRTRSPVQYKSSINAICAQMCKLSLLKLVQFNRSIGKAKSARRFFSLKNTKMSDLSKGVANTL